MSDLLQTAEMLWNGNLSTSELNPLMSMLGFEEIAPGVGFVCGFGNVTAIETDVGLMMVDTGSPLTGGHSRSLLRGWRPADVHTVVYTHGHVDHVCGIQHFPDPDMHVLAHEAVAARFDRYLLTAGYNGHINARQFQIPGLAWPTEYRYPDETYADRRDLTVGDLAVELRHARGETDDHTYVWLPERGVLCTGDLFIWASPNCGNPQKAQRYPREWAVALREMASLGAEVLCPGHGVPILGRARVKQALEETAELLQHLHDATLGMMNDGATLDDILHTVKAPTRLLERPYLRPVYDEPDFIVRNIWRLYGGWYDGNPARLKPPQDHALATQVVALAGGPEALVERARALADAQELALACQLVEWAWQAAPEVAGDAVAEIYRRRVKAETSLMAQSIYQDAAHRPKA